MTDTHQEELEILRRIVTEWDSAKGDELVGDVRARVIRLHSRLIRKALKERTCDCGQENCADHG